MNVVEAYLKFKGQLIILISGLNGAGTEEMAKMMSGDFKIKMVGLESFLLEELSSVTLPDGEKVDNKYKPEAIDWDKFNESINDKKGEGVIVHGFGFPVENLKFNADHHLHLAISKQTALERGKHEVNNPTLLMNQVIFPQYLKTKNSSKIYNYISTNDIDIKSVYDQEFDLIIKMIDDYLYHKNKQQDRKMSRIPLSPSTVSLDSDILDETISLSSSILRSLDDEDRSDEIIVDTEETV